jgi:ATP-dependent Zn protease
MGGKAMKADENIKRIAYHEAGHAVAAYRFKHEADTISIVPDPLTGILGFSREEYESMDGSTSVEQIIVLYAGWAAEHKYDSNSNPLESVGDTEKAGYLLQYIEGETESILRIKTEKIINENWNAIEALATALIENQTLKYDEWTNIIDAVDEGEDWRVPFNRNAILDNMPIQEIKND